MLFSVIVPTFNRLSMLQSSLESVFRQDRGDYEVVVVDDGSTDDTNEYLKSLDTKIRYLRQANQGPGVARNYAARYSNGAYLAFLDSDDIWFPWTLGVYSEAIKEYGSPSFVVGKPRLFHAEADLCAATPCPTRTIMFPDYLASGDKWRWWGVSSFVIRRDAFLKVGGFVEKRVNGEDADLALRLGEEARFVQIVEPITFGYRSHSVSETKKMESTLAGMRMLVSSESEGRYPGGRKRRSDRYRILTRHISPVAIECIKSRRWSEGWHLYKSTLTWNVMLHRVKFVLGFPIFALLRLLREAVRRGPSSRDGLV